MHYSTDTQTHDTYIKNIIWYMHMMLDNVSESDHIKNVFQLRMSAEGDAI